MLGDDATVDDPWTNCNINNESDDESASVGLNKEEGERGRERKEERTESHRWRSHRCADLVIFTPKGIDQITPLTRKERTLKATREERRERREERGQGSTKGADD
jgi:hypothetical protein